MPSSESPLPRLTWRWYVQRAAVCLLAAVVIAISVAVVTAPPAEDEPPIESASTRPAAEPVAHPPPSVRIPRQPVDASAAELRAEIIEHADRLLADHPDAIDVLHVVALLYADLQKTTEAVELWQRCLDQDAQRPGPYVGLARASMALGEDQRAVDTLEAAREAGFSTPDISHTWAEALSKLGRLEEAASVAREGVAAFPDSDNLWLQLGQLQLQLGQFAAAEQSLEQAAARGAAPGSVLFALATVCARQDKHEKAAMYREQFQRLKEVESAAQVSSFQSSYDTEMRRIAVGTLCRMATVKEKHDEPDAAEQQFLRACQLDPFNPLVCTEMVTFFRRRGRLADARVAQERLLETEPDQVAHYLNLASLSSELGDPGRAESALQQLIALRPELGVGYATLARLYLSQQQFDQARWFATAAARQQLGSQQETVANLLVLATANQMLGDEEAAAAAVAEARRLSPDSVESKR